MSEALLEARQLTKQFPVRGGLLRRSVGSIHAVDGVELTIAPGSTLGIVGESGCGKSTLARLLVGLEQPTDGEVRARGRPLRELTGETLKAFRRAVQMVFQDPISSLNPRMRVEEIVAEPLVIHRLATGRERSQRVDALVELVGLSLTLRRRRPKELSGGERQRVGIARALATEPAMLICDEPIASLDVSVGAQILELLRGLIRTRGLTLVFISHDLQAVASLCDHIAVMYLGRIVELAPTARLLERPWHPYTELLLRCATLDLTLEVSGERPSALRLPSGCRFRTRCPLAEARCEQREPVLIEKGPARRVACHKRH